jgi:hypothetical protein
MLSFDMIAKWTPERCRKVIMAAGVTPSLITTKLYYQVGFITRARDKLKYIPVDSYAYCKLYQDVTKEKFVVAYTHWLQLYTELFALDTTVQNTTIEKFERTPNFHLSLTPGLPAIPNTKLIICSDSFEQPNVGTFQVLIGYTAAQYFIYLSSFYNRNENRTYTTSEALPFELQWKLRSWQQVVDVEDVTFAINATVNSCLVTNQVHFDLHLLNEFLVIRPPGVTVVTVAVLLCSWTNHHTYNSFSQLSEAGIVLLETILNTIGTVVPLANAKLGYEVIYLELSTGIRPQLISVYGQPFDCIAWLVEQLDFL